MAMFLQVELSGLEMVEQEQNPELQASICWTHLLDSVNSGKSASSTWYWLVLQARDKLAACFNSRNNRVTCFRH